MDAVQKRGVDQPLTQNTTKTGQYYFRHAITKREKIKKGCHFSCTFRMCKQSKRKRTAFMTLSHAFEQTLNLSEIALNNLSLVIKANIKQAQKGDTFEEVEREIHAAFVEAERRILSETLAQYDINVPVVTLEGKLFVVSKAIRPPQRRYV